MALHWQPRKATAVKRVASSCSRRGRRSFRQSAVPTGTPASPLSRMMLSGAQPCLTSVDLSGCPPSCPIGTCDTFTQPTSCVHSLRRSHLLCQSISSGVLVRRNPVPLPCSPLTCAYQGPLPLERRAASWTAFPNPFVFRAYRSFHSNCLEKAKLH